MKLLALACERESADACQELGARYWEGNGVAKDSAKAVGFFRAACEFGMGITCIKLGERYADGSDGFVQDDVTAMDLYTLACEKGVAAACKIRRKVWPEDVPRAEQQRRDIARAAQAAAKQKDACERRDMTACGTLGEQMILGDLIPMDKSGGERLLQRSCDGGNTLACAALGRFLNTGYFRRIRYAPAST
ncbi:sel1 repeat family protein [Pendulispora rubella]|uniref:Sel1 repeat family protein n=1 Tax=Pendulispora rubella TaxID=2741070 RepID=A0ABZ2L831_9BACT